LRTCCRAIPSQNNVRSEFAAGDDVPIRKYYQKSSTGIICESDRCLDAERYVVHFSLTAGIGRCWIHVPKRRSAPEGQEKAETRGSLMTSFLGKASNQALILSYGSFGSTSAHSVRNSSDLPSDEPPGIEAPYPPVHRSRPQRDLLASIRKWWKRLGPLRPETVDFY
ncbi:hypothetical protein OSTOST_22857, partial [Ostertagia ostertagi]